MIEKDAKMERSVVDIPIYGYVLSIKTSSKVSPQVKFWSFYVLGGRLLESKAIFFT